MKYHENDLTNALFQQNIKYAEIVGHVRTMAIWTTVHIHVCIHEERPWNTATTAVSFYDQKTANHHKFDETTLNSAL